jgi:hypothetical protein
MIRQQPDMEASGGKSAPLPWETKPRPVKARRPLRARLALLQGACLLALSIRRPAGTALALGNIGAAMLYAGARSDVRRPQRLLGWSVGLSFAALELRRGRPADGLVHLVCAAAWAALELRDALRARRAPEAAFA